MRMKITLLLLFGWTGAAYAQQRLTRLEEQFKKQDTVNEASINSRVNRGVNPDRTNTYVIEYDFKNGIFIRNNHRLRVNQPVVFKIININRLAYRINISAKDSILGVSELDEIRSLFKAEEADRLKEQVKTAEGTLTPGPAVQASVQTNDLILNNEHVTKVRNALNLFNAEFMSKVNNKTDSIIDDRIDNRLVNRSMNESLASIGKLKVGNERIEGIIKSHLEAQAKLAETYLKIIADFKTMIDLSKDYININHTINNSLLQETDELNINNFYLNFERNKNINANMTHLMNQFQIQYKEIISNIELGEIVNYGGAIKLNSAVNAYASEINAIQKQVEKIDFDKLLNEITELKKLCDSKEKKRLFEYVSKPVQPYQDVVIFNIDIHKRSENSLFNNDRKFSYKEFTKNGLRLDVSLGVSGAIHAKKYSIDLIDRINPESKNSEKQIVQQNKSVFTPSFIGLLTASKRSATEWAYGVSIGMGVSAEEGKIGFDNFFIGASTIIGKYERLTLTAGPSLKSLPSLKSGYILEHFVPVNSTLDNVVDYSYRIGFFLSITYNLTKGVKDNIKQVYTLLK